MPRRDENYGAQQFVSDPAGRTETDVIRTASTYLAKIAVALQSAPDKMLTVNQLMEKVVPLIPEDRKSVENNMRVCLSTHRCFIKVVPVSGKRNYWKLDTSQITAKMVRRHFKGILRHFPELASKVSPESPSGRPERPPAARPPAAEVCKAVQVRCEVKFSSPFSIESLLKRDSPSVRGSRASPLSSVQIRVDQQPQAPVRRAWAKGSISWDPEDSLLLHTSAGDSPLCPAGGGRHPGLGHVGVSQPIRRLAEHNALSTPFYTRPSTGPYFHSPHSICYSAPAFTHEALRF
ncbi:forkhead box protein C2 [Menidia menidia]